MPIADTKTAIYYELAGEGPHVTLIHGVGNNCDDWAAVIERFRGRFTTLRYDLRGHGRSAHPPGPYAMDDFIADLCALHDCLGISRSHIVGFSLGGLIAQAFALAYPQRVDRLAILGSVAGRTDEERERVTARLEVIRTKPAADYFLQSVDRWFTDAFRAEKPDLVEAKKARIGAMDTDSYAAAYEVLATNDFADDLSRISAPTLVMTGENDIGSNPRMSRLMADRIPDAHLVILPALRHSILMEAPDVVGGILREFLTQE